MKKVTAYKVDTLENLKPNAIVALKTAGASTFSLYVTDLQGVPHSLNLPATTGVQQIVNTDGALQVVGSTNVVINLEPAILASINSALQVGDNISSLLNDAGYLTSFTESDPIFLASEASNFVAGDKANLDNQSGINTNDETTITIQTKRPLKTVTNKSLEGTGNIGIDYNDLDNKPPTFPPSSHTHIEADITDLDKYTKVETDNLLGNKLDKVSTSSVERAYIINADGSQSTKATSEFEDVLEFANLAAFPVTGESGKIYIALDNGLTYRWNGSVYVQIGGKRYHSMQFQVPNSATTLPADQKNLHQPRLGNLGTPYSSLGLTLGNGIPETAGIVNMEYMSNVCAKHITPNFKSKVKNIVLSYSRNTSEVSSPTNIVLRVLTDTRYNTDIQLVAEYNIVSSSMPVVDLENKVTIPILTHLDLNEMSNLCFCVRTNNATAQVFNFFRLTIDIEEI